MALSKKIAIVIPTFNEAKNIELLINEILRQIVDSKVIVVDDNSPDGTAKKVEKLSRKFPNSVYLIKRKQRSGIGSANIEGFIFGIKQLGAELLFSMDADLSHNPKYLPEFIKKINEGSDVVIGSRYIEGAKIIGWNTYRKFMSKSANTVARNLLGLKINDVTSGYKCYKAEVLKAINYEKIRSEGYSFHEEIIFLCFLKGFKITEVPITFVDRIAGRSKLSKKEIINFFRTILQLFLKYRVFKSKGMGLNG